MAGPANFLRRYGTGLRGRMVLGFLSLAVLIGITGGAGLWFVHRIERDVATLSDIALPLLRESHALAVNAERTRKTAREAAELADPSVPLAELSRLTADGRHRLTQLHDLARRADNGIRIEPIEAAHATLLEMIEAGVQFGQRRHKSARIADEQFARFDRARAMLQQHLAGTAADLEQRMVAAEDSAKVTVQSGGATIDWLAGLMSESMTETFPALQGVYRLMRDTTKLEEIAKSARIAASAEALAPLETDAQRTIKSGGNALQRLAGRMRAEDARARLQTIRQALTTMQATLEGPDGIFAARRDVIAALTEFDEAQKAIAVLDAEYLASLAASGQAAEDLNRSAETAAGETAHQAMLGLMAVLGCGIILAAAMGLILASRLSAPLSHLAGIMRNLAADQRPDVPYLHRRDEIGGMASAVQVFKENAIEMDRLRMEQDASREQAEAAKRAALVGMAETIEASAGAALNRIGESTASMNATAGEMNALASRTDRSAQAAASAATQALSTAQMVAGAAEELAASIREISGQVTRSSDVVGQAVQAGSETRDAIEALNDQVGRIGSVAEMIGEIASKTNLLALNATIEAARAGDAGKGFAVVAGEVKALAAQTARSTGEISQRINEVRAATGAAVMAVARIETRIGEISAIAGSIAAAVEEQGAATAEIARNVGETAAAANEMTARNLEVSDEARRAGAHASQVLADVRSLDTAVGELKQSVIRTVRTSAEEVDRRAFSRMEVDLAARIEAAGGAPHQVRVTDLSAGGARIAGDQAISEGVHGVLHIAGFSTGLPFVGRGSGKGHARLAFMLDHETTARLEAFIKGIVPRRAA